MRKYGLLPLMLCMVTGCASLPPASVRTLPTVHEQALTVEARGTRARVTLWQKENNIWYKNYPSVSGVIGRNGLAPAGEKREGDGHAPSGTYPLGTAFGYAPSFATGLDYRQAGPDDIWVDDPASPEYNHWVKAPTTAASFEQLRRNDHLYKIAAVIEYNTSPVVSGNGSAIFMHIWRRYDHPTAGCVALSERHLRRILRRLDRTKQPVIILEEDHGHR